MVLPRPRLGERIASRHAEEIGTQIRLEQLKPDPSAEAATTVPLLRLVPAGDQTAHRGDDAAVDPEPRFDLAHVVEERGCKDGTGGFDAERPLDLTRDPHRMSPV